MTVGVLVLLAAWIAAIELLRRLPLFAAFGRLAVTSRRSGRVLRRRASDHWKERATRGLSARMLGDSLRALLLLALIAAPIAAALLLDAPLKLGTMAALTDPLARSILLDLTLCYAAIRFALARRLFAR